MLCGVDDIRPTFLKLNRFLGYYLFIHLLTCMKTAALSVVSLVVCLYNIFISFVWFQKIFDYFTSSNICCCLNLLDFSSSSSLHANDKHHLLDSWKRIQDFWRYSKTILILISDSFGAHYVNSETILFLCFFSRETFTFTGYSTSFFI